MSFSVPKWLQTVEIGSVLSYSGYGFESAIAELFKTHALKNGLTCFGLSGNEGRLGCSFDEVRNFICDDLGGELIYRDYPSPRLGADVSVDDVEGYRLFVMPTGFVKLRLTTGFPTTLASITIESTNAVHVEAVRAFVAKNIHKDENKGRVYVIVRTDSGMEAKQIGTAGVDFEAGNYNEDVISDYEHVVQDFGTADPCGRLVLLDGPPGTGKTYFVRSLLKSVPKATFVLVPPQMVSELSGPELVTSLTGIRAENGNKSPVILVIEDGERVLLPRQDDNDMSVTSMLNICDGIFGTVMDLRVLVTTNEKNERVDAALKRSGRLCRSIHVGRLESRRAQAVFTRLTGESRSFPDAQQLSDIYRMARDRGWKPRSNDDDRLGFKMSNPSGPPAAPRIMG